jgi:hypothetical protein
MKALTENSNSFFGHGVSQTSRMPIALDPEYVKLDDRGLSELLSFSASLGEHINFFNLENDKDGDWSSFFHSNISVILATIISYDIDKSEKKYNNLVSSFMRDHDISAKEKYFVELFALNYEILKQFDLWFSRVSKTNKVDKNFEHQIEAELYNIIQEKLAFSCLRLKSYFLSAIKKSIFKKAPNLDFDSFNPIWELGNATEDDIYFGKTKLEQITSGTLQLRLVFRNLSQTLKYCIFHFEKYFYRSLRVKQDHSPNIALFITFLKLFNYIQKDFNNLSKKLLKFYYEKYLHLHSLGSVPDQLFVCFELAPMTTRHHLAQQTLLDAGLDQFGNPLIFEIVEPLEVTKAKIKELKTIYSSRVDDLDTSHYKLISHLYCADVANSKDGEGKVALSEHEEWPLFGDEQEYKPDDQVSMKSAEIGLAISSPVLELNEGKREVTATFNFIPETTRIFKRLVIDIYQKVNAEKEPDEPRSSIEDVFYGRIFNQIDATRNIKIYLSGRKGWIEVDANTISIKADGSDSWGFDDTVNIEDTLEVLNALTFNFTLPVPAAPVVNFDPTVFPDEKFEANQPVMKIVLNDRKQPFSYSFLYALEVHDVNLRVNVTGIKNIQLYDDDRNVLATRGYLPFGFQPMLGSTHYIGSTELFKKPLKNVDINVKWDKMVKNVLDYKENYKGYKDDFNPAEVTLRFGALMDYEFATDYDESLEFPLFTTTDGDPDCHDQTLLDKSEFHLTEHAFDNLLFEPDVDIPDINPLNDNTRSGYFQIEMIGPDHTMGHASYQQAVNDAVSRNIENPQAGIDIPKDPVTPHVREIVINYEAEAHFNVAYGDVDKPEKLFHIHPFGIETSYEDGSPIKSSLMPKYVEDGFLFIGLENVNAPESLSLYFELSSKRSKIATLNTIPQISWKYLMDNHWYPFSDSQILSDGTEGFTQSGIVKLQLPMELLEGNSILNEELCWISVSVTGDTELLCEAILVKENGVLAQRVLNENEVFIEGEPMAPNSIKGLLNNQAQITNVVQPFESFGGKTHETDNEFFCRVSERLRHKNRAVTHWDFERLVLQEFPNIKQVKCLSFLTNPLEDGEEIAFDKYLNIEEEREDITGIKFRSGISIVAIPKKKLYAENNTPKFSLNQLLRIQTYLSHLVSKFTKISVVNPLYEYVRVFGNVKFIENHNNGVTLGRLMEDINNFISPWLKNENELIKIGGALNENVLQNYIKGLPYVKFFTKFSILHIIEEDGIFKLQDTASNIESISIIKTRPWGVLLPDNNHDIEMVEFEEEEEPMSKVNADEVIRFQNKVNILGENKYIKIKNPLKEKQQEDLEAEEVINIEFKI